MTGKGSPTTREAKEFLVAQIVEEAQREGVPLSEVERKMLYFSETDWTLPDIMQVNDEFDRDYDQNEYEEKIAKLIRSATKRVRKENPTEYGRWLDAIRQLSTEDHYILIMVQRAGLPTGAGSLVRPLHDKLKLWGTGFAIVGSLVCVISLAEKYSISPVLAIWLTLVVIGVAHVLLRLIFGASRVDSLVSRILANLFVFPSKDK